MSRTESIVARLVDRVSPSRNRGTTGKGLTQDQEEEIGHLFQLCDANRDGSVTKFELKEALWSLGQRPGEDEMDVIFREYDVNKRGALDFTEFKRLMTARLMFKNTREEFADAFRAVDGNKDGNIDVQELKKLMVATGFGLAEQELHEIFDMFDKNGSGKVDMEEFMDYMMGTKGGTALNDS